MDLSGPGIDVKLKERKKERKKSNSKFLDPLRKILYQILSFQFTQIFSDMLDCHNVATPLWAKCEGEAHTPKSGKLESSGTPKNSERNGKGQISSHVSALGVIEKVLKCRCPKWPCMSHLDICSPRYGQKKGRELN
jgi:hypothetical protein